ncbi:unnamed protein product, partial [Symbiodinium necroappetens]
GHEEEEEDEDRAENQDETDYKDLSDEDFEKYVDEVMQYIDDDKDDAIHSDGEDAGDKDQDDKACTFNVTSARVADWLSASSGAPNSACQDFGPRFGSWGRRGCPKSLAEIVHDVQSGTSEAEGGKSGTKPLISARFVVKVIDKTEHKQLGRLLQKLRGSRRDTFLVPTCRSLVFNVDGTKHYLQVALNMRLQGAEEEPWQKLFDLKGNWAYFNRLASDEEQDSPKKALVEDIKTTMCQELEASDSVEVSFVLKWSKDVQVWKDRDKGRDLFAKTLRDDSKLLAGLGLMDYSLMLHVAEFKGYANLQLLNLEKPWAFAMPNTASMQRGDTLYVLSFGIIDLLMHEEENRGMLNKLMSGITLSQCQVSDLDPIPARAYWIRFIRMLGLRLRYGPRCTSCLREKRRRGFTYFPNKWGYEKSKEYKESCKIAA